MVNRNQIGDPMNTLKTRAERITLALMIFLQDAVYGVRRRWNALKENPQAGLQTVEWIFLVVGILVIAGIVIVAVTAFVNAQIAKMPN